ncbi:MAG: carbohydrate ABC transporter permease [Candidatus Merdivicinus sp.]|jgi:putative aldouronate transport system permease protein
MEKITTLQDRYETTGTKVFHAINTVFIILVSLLSLFPFIHIVAKSFSSGKAIMSNQVLLWPVEFQLDSYTSVFKDANMTNSFGFTIILTLLYTVICMAMTILAAYPMSKSYLPGKKVLMTFIIITMYFNAGTIPNYMVVKNLHLLDTIWSLILPGMISAYNMIILRTFFTSISPSMLEAASLDGCSDFRALTTIVLPLSLPILATLSLFYAVGRWNGFSDALYYINDQNLYPLQLKLREIILSDRMSDIASLEASQMQKLVPDGVKAASIVFATVPILIPYPFLQKFFISGVMIGAVKE